MSNYSLRPAVVFALAVLFFSSCKKDEETTVTTENYKGYFVVNEGGFGNSNASIGLFKPSDNSYFDAFKKANERPIGDVVQSMTLIDGKYYIAVNNSNKVEVVNQADFKVQSTISTTSPRYVLRVDTEKAYISNLYSNTLKVLNTKTNTITSSIDIHHQSDHQALMDGKVYVATFDNIIMVIDVKSNTLIDSIPTGSGLNKIVNAGASKLAVLCNGLVDWNNGSVIEKGGISFISKDTAVLENTFELSTGSYGGSLVYSSSTQYFYYSLGNHIVYRMNSAGVSTPFITLDVINSVYGISINESSGELFVCDAGDFNSAGKVSVYDLTGAKLREFNAGIAPNAVVFNNN